MHHHQHHHHPHQATGNGDPADVGSLQQQQARSWRGELLVVVQPDGSALTSGGSVSLVASCPSHGAIQGAQVQLTVQ
jgi:hypothetical protein